MATLAQWLEGARLRTLPLAIAPVLAGGGAAVAAIGGFSTVFIGSPHQSGDNTAGFHLWRMAISMFLAAIVALSLQIGSNFANDYSDGIRGTDDERVGPLRLTASGVVAPHMVKRAAFISLGVGTFAGLLLALVSGAWWLIPVGILAVLAAWFYTGGKHPYGYFALGEVFVFIFFGLVATLGTGYAMVSTITPTMWAAAVAVGLFSCAVLMVNNLRDIPTDSQAGKTTLAVLLGEQRSRTAYALMVSVPFALLIVPIAQGHSTAVIAVLAAALVIGPLRIVLARQKGAALIPCIKATGIATLIYAVLFGLGVAL